MDRNDFQTVLKHLKFRQVGNVFAKEIRGAVMKVDFAKERIIYPDGVVVHGQQTCNFAANENFVVFECVHRLLEKGYQPQHLELEKKYPVGHGGSGGRSDVVVRDNAGENILLIIECKTAGDEFNREKGKMESQGGQLFSYLQQDRNTRYLCLYCSEFKDSQVEYQSAIVKIIDREDDIEAFKKGDESIKLFRDAKNKAELFEVWKNTFSLYFHYNGIFEDDVNAYEIELKPLKRKNLRPLSEATSTFNIFMEILRHNNISDNANAFNRILSLLLCKIVDEEKGDDEILDFQVKEGEDAEAIQDRLQRLYAQGMKEHLQEDIVYFEDEEIRQIIKKYPRQTPIDRIEHIFKQIKYYTQNEFALKEVHNEELFLQNARVLNEVIKLLQNFQFRYNKKQQILGDFFELLLNHGVKQSEGQFFTPVPLVRFILLSIGLDRIVEQKISVNDKNFLPRILDYACGAGHFLTESIDELQQHIEQIDVKRTDDKDVVKNIKKYKRDTDWAGQYIYGIEKDYRLARTSQVACFLNGDGAANVIYGDGLEDQEKINKKHQFDVIVSNPPYSIKSFRNYLQVDGEKYKLFDALTESSSEIEALFIERTAQLLRPGGVAGIILPSSILQNTGIYTKTRELLLEHFEFKAISEFDSGTFGATGTTTVVLFLKRRPDDFKRDRRYIAEDLFNGVKRNGRLEHIKSANLLGKYVSYLGLDEADYQTLLNKAPNAALCNSQLWQDYQEKFQNFANDKKRFINAVLEAESERFYYFMLSLNDAHSPQTIVITTAGEGTHAKQFRGYEFSNRKGRQGIKMFDDNQMFDNEDYKNPQKASSYILKNIWDEQLAQVDSAISEHVRYTLLTDMLNFDHIELDKQINPNPSEKIDIKSKWDFARLEDLLPTIESGSRPKGGVGNISSGALSLGGEHIDPNNGKVRLTTPKYVSESFFKGSTKGILQKHDILLCKDGALTGKIALLGKELDNKMAMINEHVFLMRGRTLIEQKYVFLFLYSTDGQALLKHNKTGAIQGGLNSTKLKQIKIPLPGKEVQKKIVAECETAGQTRQAVDAILKKYL